MSDEGRTFVRYRPRGNEKTLRVFHGRYATQLHRAGINPRVVAGILGVDRRRAMEWFRGDRLPRPSEIASIADLLGVSADWLLGRTTSPEPPTDAVRVSHRPVIPAAEGAPGGSAGLEGEGAHEDAAGGGTP